jgi:hypothetical protein
MKVTIVSLSPSVRVSAGENLRRTGMSNRRPSTPGPSHSHLTMNSRNSAMFSMRYSGSMRKLRGASSGRGNLCKMMLVVRITMPRSEDCALDHLPRECMGWIHQPDKPGHGEAEERNIPSNEVLRQELCVVRPHRCLEHLDVVLWPCKFVDIRARRCYKQQDTYLEFLDQSISLLRLRRLIQ